MKVLLDHNLPKQLRLKLRGHLALTARQLGWDALSNGRLLAMAATQSFDVLLTADRKMYSQNSHLDRKVSIVALTGSQMKQLEPVLDAILAAIERATPGSFEEVTIPMSPRARNTQGRV